MVRQISDTVSVMHNGRQVDGGLVETIFQEPESDDTRAPIDAIHAGQEREVERMTTATLPKRLGFFTRLLDQAEPAERYRLATAQIIHAERCGYDSAWVAQHHFHEDEGGLPAPFVFLAQVAAQTSRIRLGTGIVTLPLELPIRVAEDAAVLDLMCGGRLEVGVGGGGNLSSYEAFGRDSAERGALLTGHLQVLRDAWAGRPLLWHRFLGRPVSEYGRLCHGAGGHEGGHRCRRAFMLTCMKRLAVSSRRGAP